MAVNEVALAGRVGVVKSGGRFGADRENAVRAAVFQLAERAAHGLIEAFRRGDGDIEGGDCGSGLNVDSVGVHISSWR